MTKLAAASIFLKTNEDEAHRPLKSVEGHCKYSCWYKRKKSNIEMNKEQIMPRM